MANKMTENKTSRHLRITDPSPWFIRFAPLVPEGGCALDLACGGGRHARHLLDMGMNVVGVDKDISAVADLADNPKATLIETDLEDGSNPFANGGVLAGRSFDAVVVVNYLYRPLMDGLVSAVSEGGVFLYETFARGNERYTRPRNPDHLLKSGELLQAVEGRLNVVGYEHGIVEKGPLSGVIQRIAAVRDKTGEPRKVFP